MLITLKESRYYAPTFGLIFVLPHDKTNIIKMYSDLVVSMPYRTRVFDTRSMGSKDPTVPLYVDSEDSGQTWQMSRLINGVARTLKMLRTSKGDY